MARWAIHLSQFDVEFKLQLVIKAQALTNFIVERRAREVTKQVEIDDGG